MVVVVASSHPWASGKRQAPADLLAGEWIMREPGSGTRSAFESMLAAIGVNPGELSVALTLPSNEAVRAAVMAGRFATAVSELVAAPYLKAGLLNMANIDLSPRSFYLLRHNARYHSKASLALEGLIRQAGST